MEDSGRAGSAVGWGEHSPNLGPLRGARWTDPGGAGQPGPALPCPLVPGGMRGSHCPVSPTCCPPRPADGTWAGSMSSLAAGPQPRAGWPRALSAAEAAGVEHGTPVPALPAPRGGRINSPPSALLVRGVIAIPAQRAVVQPMHRNAETCPASEMGQQTLLNNSFERELTHRTSHPLKVHSTWVLCSTEVCNHHHKLF